MAGVLTLASNVTCGHAPGKVATSSSAKLTVAGSSVLLKDGVEGKTVSLCGTPPSNSSAPCKTVTAVSSGEASTLNADGRPVLLDTIAGATDGIVASVTPVLLLAASAGQTKLTAS